MTLSAIAAAAVIWAALMLVAHRRNRLTARCRRILRPHAERYVIEKRWLERWSRSPGEFETQWRHRLRRHYRSHVPWRDRALVTPGDFERALNAEFAGLLNREIDSWTFIDRASDSPAAFARLVARSLEQLGWTVRLPAEDRRQGAHLILEDGRNRVAARLHHAATEIECRAVQEVVAAARRDACNLACIVTNGRIGGAVQTLAAAFEVRLLHCSQLDQIGGPAAAADPDLRLAA
jgi:hypothetical protein